MADATPLIEQKQIQVTEEWRTSKNGLRCLVFRADPTDVTVVPCLLEDSLHRREEIDLPRSTVLLLVPMPVLGEQAYDPTADRVDGQPVYRLRTTLCHLDIARSVASILNDISRAKATDLVDARGNRL